MKTAIPLLTLWVFSASAMTDFSPSDFSIGTNWLPLGCTTTTGFQGLTQVNSSYVNNLDSNTRCALAAARLGSQYYATSISSGGVYLACYIFNSLPAVSLNNNTQCIDIPNFGMSCASSQRACTGSSGNVFMGVFPQFDVTGGIMSRVKTTIALPGWRNTWYPFPPGLPMSPTARVSTYTNDTTLSACQTSCNNDLGACAYGWAMMWVSQFGQPTSTCRCYQCMYDGTNLFVQISTVEIGNTIAVRDGWGMAVNASDANATGLVLRNGTVLPLSLCSIGSLSLIPQASTYSVISDNLVGSSTTVFTSTCLGNGSCGWQYSYTTTQTAEVSLNIGFEFSDQAEEDLGVVKFTESATMSVAMATTASASTSDSSTLSGTILPGQTARVQKQWRELVYRSQKQYRLYGGIRVVRAMNSGAPGCYVEDLGQELTDTQTVFSTSEDSKETTSVYVATTA